MDATSDEPQYPAGWCANRRMLLCGVGGLAAAGLLSACGDSNAAKASGVPSGATNAGKAAGVPSGTPGVPSDTPSVDVLATTAEVPVGGGTVAGAVLIVQPVAGRFKAYDAACPHKGVIVRAPADGVITCPAHGSTFSMADGSRTGGPAPHGLTEIAVAVEGANIVKP